jgi:hypothetical protein
VNALAIGLAVTGTVVGIGFLIAVIVVAIQSAIQK